MSAFNQALINPVNNTDIKMLLPQQEATAAVQGAIDTELTRATSGRIFTSTEVFASALILITSFYVIWASLVRW